VRRAKLVAHLAILSWLLACPSRAGEIEPFLAEGRIGAHIRDLAFPATLSKDLTSGLTSRLLARVELRAGTRRAAQSAVEITVKYDLWDENFRVIVTVDRHVASNALYGSLAEVRAFLQDVRVPGMFAPSGPPPGSDPLTLQANVLLNPVDRERMERIRAWVKENSTPAPSDPTSAGAAAPVGAATSNALFDRIFAQYAGGTDLAAAWHETLASKPFRVEGLVNEGQ
jgi:hypothetical protein